LAIEIKLIDETIAQLTRAFEAKNRNGGSFWQACDRRIA